MDLQDVSFQDEKVASDFWSNPVKTGQNRSKRVKTGQKPVKNDGKSPFPSEISFFDHFGRIQQEMAYF